MAENTEPIENPGQAENTEPANTTPTNTPPVNVYTISDWLKGMVADYDVPDAAITAILYNNRVNGVTANMSMDDAPEKGKDLCLADLYMFLATSSSKTGSVYDADGGWQRGRSTKNVIDRDWFREAANRLYLKWAPEKVDSTGTFVLKGIY